MYLFEVFDELFLAPIRIEKAEFPDGELAMDWADMLQAMTPRAIYVRVTEL